MKNLDKYGKWAAVAGASEGLGRAFAIELAKSGKNLILISRRKEQLDSVANDISSEFGVQARTVVCDLAVANAYSTVMEALRSEGCRLVVYNAAYGPVKMFTDNSLDELDYYLDLNARTLIKLLWSFTNEYQNGDPAGILVMSSMAGLRGTQMVAPYAATKAFDWNLAESLHYELKEKSIDVSTMCAGPIKTPNYLGTKPQFKGFKPAEHEPDFVAKEALALLGKKALGLPGSHKFNNFFLTHLLPRKAAVGIVNKTMRNIYAHFWK